MILSAATARSLRVRRAMIPLLLANSWLTSFGSILANIWLTMTLSSAISNGFRVTGFSGVHGWAREWHSRGRRFDPALLHQYFQRFSVSYLAG